MRVERVRGTTEATAQAHALMAFATDGKSAAVLAVFTPESYPGTVDPSFSNGSPRCS